MSVAPSWPLICVALEGRTFRSTTDAAPGLNFDSFRPLEAQFQEICPEFVLQTFKTQNDARAHNRTRPSQLFASRTEKARNLTVSQRLTPGNPLPRRRPCFPAAVPIWDGDRGDSRVKPANPHTFLCTPCSGLPRRTPFASIPRARAAGNSRLLQFHLGASLLELGLDLVGFVLVHAFLDRLGGAFDEVLGFLEAEAGDGADFLDDLDLLVAGGGKNDREFGLFFNGSRGSGGRAGHRNGGSGGHAPLFFEQLCELGSLKHGEAREVVD